MDTENFMEVSEISGEALVAVAVHAGKTRLIDNASVRSVPRAGHAADRKGSGRT